jgi:hypothetical protein
MRAIPMEVSQADLALVRSTASHAESPSFLLATGATIASLTAPNHVIIAGTIITPSNEGNVSFDMTLAFTDSASDTLTLTFSIVPLATAISGGAVAENWNVWNGTPVVITSVDSPEVVQVLSKTVGAAADLVTVHFSFALPLEIPVGFTVALTAAHNLSAMTLNATLAEAG